LESGVLAILFMGGVAGRALSLAFLVMAISSSSLDLKCGCVGFKGDSCWKVQGVPKLNVDCDIPLPSSGIYNDAVFVANSVCSEKETSPRGVRFRAASSMFGILSWLRNSNPDEGGLSSAKLVTGA